VFKDRSLRRKDDKLCWGYTIDSSVGEVLDSLTVSEN
jgi:hypothetical protein